MKIFYCDQFAYPLPEGHRFPAPKYGLLRRQVSTTLVPPAELHVPNPATDAQLLLVHEVDYLERCRAGTLTPKEIRRIGLPWSPELLERSRRSVGSTISACRAALEDGIGVSLTGGTHHAFRDHGEGFCVLNDCAVALRVMQAEGRIGRGVVIDCDVHQGNGTAAIFAEDPSIYTFSVHGAKNFPFHKGRSDLDIELPDATDDAAYLAALERGVQRAIADAGADLAIYLAGADPYVDDVLGRLSLTKAGLAARDHMVLDFCKQAGLPVAIVMGGGYARNIQDTVEIHLETVRIAVRQGSRSQDHNVASVAACL